MSPLPRRTAGALVRLCALTACITHSLPSQVVELLGGGSSYFRGAGAVANIWGPAYDGWLGLGVQGGLRAGVFARTAIGRDSLRAGNDMMVLRYPSDIFGLGYTLLVQGVTWTAVRGPLRIVAFGGASSTGLGVPLFSAQRTERPFAAVMVVDSIAPNLQLFATLLGTRRQTAFGGIHWRDSAGVDLAATAGIGANRPFGALSATFVRAHYEVRASYSAAAKGYRRADLPVPAQPRLDGPAVELIVRPLSWMALTATRQTFVKDSGIAVEITRASGTSLIATARHLDQHAAVGAYFAESVDGHDVSAYAAVGRAFGERLALDVYALAVRPRGSPFRVTPVVMLHERATESIVLDQTVTVSGAQTSVAFGGTYAGALADVGIGYQIVHAPFDPVHPFVRTLNLSLRFNVGSYRATIGTTLLPTGQALYDATAATYLYFGGENGPSHGSVAMRMAKFQLRGIVTDVAHLPIAGAAVSVGGSVVYTGADGRFFLRTNSLRRVPLLVSLPDFLTQVRYELVSAPLDIAPDTDGSVTPVVILVRALP